MNADAPGGDEALHDAEIAVALDVARRLISAGVPMFVARPDPTRKSGYLLPPKWETSRPLLDVVDRWRPGWALCAVGGHACDFLDVDVQNGGDADEVGLRQAGMWPASYGRARTPSGGTHDIIAPLRIPKNKVTDGIDLQGGLPEPDAEGETGRGFVFISPTVRTSKIDGVARPYRWIAEPDMELLAEDGESDDSGQGIAGLVAARSSRNKGSPSAAGSPTTAPPDPVGLLRVRVTAFEALTAEGSNRTQELDNLALLAGHGVPRYWTAEAARARLLEAAGANGYIAVHGRRDALVQIESGLTDGAAKPWLPVDPSERAYQAEVASELRRLKIRDEATRLFRVEQDATTEVKHDRFIVGGTFIYDAPDKVPAIWGRGDEVLWSLGEPLLITGPTGVGKTSLGGQVIAGRLGLIPDVLGYPVVPGRRVLYLAMDRPAQIARALARLLKQFPRDILNERIVFWRGPPPSDLATHPDTLLELARRAGADTVVLDSLKDAAVNLSDEAVGQGLSRAMGLCIAEGIEVMGYHHQTKRGNGGVSKPNSIADVYGSGWITAGVGSVILLWGEAGDPIIELSHLKPPADQVGPLQLIHDMSAGTMSLMESEDLMGLLLAAPRTPAEVAMVLYGVTSPSKAQVEKARRKIVKLVAAGLAVQLGGYSSGGAAAGHKGGGAGARYGAAAHPDRSTPPHDRSTNRSTDRSTSVHVDLEKITFPQVDTAFCPVTSNDQADRSTDRSTQLHANSVSAGQSVHASVHAQHGPFHSTSHGVSPSKGTPWVKRGDLENGRPAEATDVGGDEWVRAHLTTAPQTVTRLAGDLGSTERSIETALCRLEAARMAQCHDHNGQPDSWSLPSGKDAS